MVLPSGDTTVLVCENSFFRPAVEIHRENLIATTEHDGVVIIPHRTELGCGRRCQSHTIPALGRHQVKFCIVLVLLHVGIAHSVEHLAAVGTDSILAHHTQAPHHLGSEATVSNGDLRFLNHLLLRSFLLACSKTKRGCCQC